MALDYKYFIYALDIKKGKITAAWYCPDEETADQVFSIVDRRMEEEYGTEGFDFGIAATETCEDSYNVLEYTAPPRYEEEEGERKLLCKFGDFVRAAEQTKKHFRTAQKHRLDIQYMFFIKLAMEGKPFPEIVKKTKEKITTQNREELDGRRLAAIKYAQKHPATALDAIERKFNLGEKTLSRSPYKEMIKKFADDRRKIPNTPNKGKRMSYRGKKEKISKSVSGQTPDPRRSHEAEVDERLDGINEV